MMQSTKNPIPESPSERLQEWIAAYGQYLLYGVVLIIVALFLFLRFFSPDTKSSVQTTIKTDRAFAQFSDPKTQILFPEKWDEAFSLLQQGMASNPDLNQKYDAPIAQVLLNKGFAQEAQPFAERAFFRTYRDQLPFYTSYAQTSLLIGKGEKKEALTQAEHLQEEIEKAATSPNGVAFGDLLPIYNLLRIALLRQDLGLPNETAAWDAFSTSLTKEGEPTEALLETLTIGNITLPEYITARKEALRSR